MVHVGGGIIMSPAEVGWGGRDATPAEVGDGADVGEVEAEEMTQWATSVTDDQAVERQTGQWNYRSNETQNARAFKPV